MLNDKVQYCGGDNNLHLARSLFDCIQLVNGIQSNSQVFKEVIKCFCIFHIVLYY